MKNLTPHCETYLNFLRLSGDVRKSEAFPQLDLPEERLLDLLATYWSSGKKITVLKAMQMSSDASSTTVHRRLKTLRLKGMLELDLDEDDNRVKYIMPTQLALDYLSQLGQSILEAAATR